MKRGGGFVLLLIWLNAIAAQAQTFIPKPLSPAHGELAPTFLEQHGWHVVIAGALLFALIGVVILLLSRPRQVVPEPPGVAARRTLESWKARAEDGKLVSDVSRVLRQYVIAAFGFPHEELTTTEFRESLQRHPKIPVELSSATANFLRRCDEWKFAPAPETPPVPLGAVATALDLLNKLESSRAPDIVKS